MPDSQKCTEFNASQILGSWEKLTVPELIKVIKNERRWLRKVLGILLYHEYQCAQYENIRNIKWTIVKTAEVLDMSVGAVSESIALAKFLPHCEGYEKITRDTALRRMRERKRISDMRDEERRRA